MFTLSEIKNLKRELGFSNEKMAELSGVPLSTVQKVMGGTVEAPRESTLIKLSMALEGIVTLGVYAKANPYARSVSEAGMVNEESLDYSADSVNAKNVSCSKIDDTPQKVLTRKVFAECDPDFVWNGKRQGEFTIEDYYSLPEEFRAELIDGILYEVSAPAIIHQRILREVVRQFFDCMDEHENDCEMLFAPADVIIDGEDGRSVVQPDIMVCCDETKVTDRYVLNAPDLVIEILSPSTQRKDKLEKLNKYWTSGCREYWIIDPEKKTITVYDFEHDELNIQYDFTDKVPVLISEGKCEIDFSKLRLL